MNTNELQKEPLKILVHAPLGVGGVTNLMLEIQRKIDRDKLNFDYLVFHDRLEPQEKSAIALGSKKLVASTDFIKFRPLRGFFRLFIIAHVCKKNQVKIFHFNGGAPMGLLTMMAAKLGGVRWITFHSHNGGMSNKGYFAKPISFICKPFLKIVVDDFWACSSLAAEFSFPSAISKARDYYFMPNAIDLEKYRYDENIRMIERTNWGLEGKYIVGHAGRLTHQKNHDFLIDIFAEIYKKDRNTILLLFGIGELEAQLRQKVIDLGLDDHVRFCGISSQMERMYQMMDVFVMPSLFEGLPVTGVEAQAAGLPIIFSDVITKEMTVSPNVEYVSLSKSADEWADVVLKYKNYDRKSYVEELKLAGFDQDNMVHHFQEYYLKVGKELKLI